MTVIDGRLHSEDAVGENPNSWGFGTTSGSMNAQFDLNECYLAQCKPNCGKIAERNLKRQGIRTFLPLSQQTRCSGTKFVSELRPLFPGYIFVGVHAGGQCWRAINSTYGVSRIVAFCEHPARVPSAFVADLMRRCDAEGRLLPPPQLAPGDRVRVISGSFANFLAEVDTITPDQRIWVLLDLMGRSLRIELPEASVTGA
ncbi:transcription termination/antitermination protein NusG [Cypionkella sp.]|uniref:transcription termination/antitermination protein NusG n=1 Tax=Cypionkella sp. TaxID=2811411 RepID=UPI00271B2D94|nr:transcription termination/antitermination NusG family protein [Cypionkella sp.]MDO8982390.1 transcription termination/antitermination NusG family protein [Cypionkella sp.]